MRRTGLDGWVVALPLLMLVLLQVLLVTGGIIPGFRDEAMDPDSYMRLARVIDLHDGGAWFDPVYPRINPPEGHALHWTRPLDVLLLAGAAPLEPFLGFRRALQLWGALLNPLLMAGALLAVLWASAPVLDRRGQVLAGLAFTLQPTIVSYGSTGRPDHHGLLLFLFALMLALVPRLIARPERRGIAWLAGTVSALAVWVSIEAFTFVAVALAAVGAFWLLGRAGMAGAGLRYALACASALAAALAVERAPAAWTVIENDRLSVLHLIVIGAVAAFWAVALFGERIGLLRKQHARLFTVGLTGGLIVAGLCASFPDLAAGPTGRIDPLYRDVHYRHISEIQPLVAWSDLTAGDWAPAVRRLLVFAGFALVAVPYALQRLLKERGGAHPLWAFVAAGLVLFLPLSLHQLRWSMWIQLLALIPYAALLGAILRRLERSLAPYALVVARPVAAAAGLVWALLLPHALLPSAGAAAPLASTCWLPPMAGFLRTIDGPATIMTLPDFGPELLYRTGHNVLSIGNHRFQPGFTASYRALTARDGTTARALLDRHGVDWILLCPDPLERTVWEHGGASSETLYRRLLERRGPRWLRPVELPAPLQAAFMLFAVEPESAPGADDEPIALAPSARASGGAAHRADERNER